MRRQALALPVLFVAGCIFDAPEDAVTDPAATSPTTMGATTDFYDIVYVAKGTQLRVYEGDVLTYTATDSSTFVELQEDPTLTGAVWALHQNGDLERFRCRASVQVTGAGGDQEALPQGGRAKRGRRFWRYPKVLMQLINDESEQLSSLVIRNLSQK